MRYRAGGLREAKTKSFSEEGTIMKALVLTGIKQFEIQELDTQIYEEKQEKQEEALQLLLLR